jgi:hypothetical protein
MRLALLLCACTLSWTAPAAASAQGSTYEEVAGQLVGALEPWWVERLGRYDPGRGGSMTVVNANLLLVYSVAAQQGLTGPVRNDARARSIARVLTRPPIWRATPPPGQPEVRGPGWMDGTGQALRHPVHDSEAADALAQAYAARIPLGLDALTVARIRHQIARVARGPDYSWPALRLNQFNWNVAMLAADAQVNGATNRLALELGRLLPRFFAGENNLGPGLRFRYLPRHADRARANLDSPEYANTVLGFTRHYASARAAGMPAPKDLPLLRDWIRRALAGYWTHAGYLNWDTGLGLARWHQRKKVALAQRALIGIAATPELQPSADDGAWAKWLLDRGLTEYVDLLRRTGHVPAGVAYGVPEHQNVSGAYVAAARYAGNAMRALQAGLAGAPSAQPPALYSYDPDTGKLAISTPSYNTAIVPVNRHAFPYGGLDIARLFDAHQEVAGSLGGTGPAAFGLQVRSGARTLLRTQYGSRTISAGNPLRLDGLKPGRVHAGPFSDLRVHGSVRANHLRAASAYRFTPTAIEASWAVRGARGDASVTFPSWGSRATAIARTCDGRSVALKRTLTAGICRLEIRSGRSGYTVTPTAPATARLIAARREPTNPNPGPSVAIELGPVPAALAATIVVN